MDWYTHPYKLWYFDNILNLIALAVKKNNPTGKPTEYKINTAVDKTVITYEIIIH